MKLNLTLTSILLFAAGSLFSQTFTMGKKCRASLETAKAELLAENYSQALVLFESFSSKCKTRDSKEAAALGKAEAYNQLKQYSLAIEEADKALKITKQKSLNGHFQKAIALNKTGDVNGSKTELNQLIILTEKNENISQRASNYALMAALYERQLSDIDSAQVYLEKAKAMDPNNANYLIQEGTMYSSLNNFSKAFESYNQAKKMSPENLELAIAMSNTRLRMMEDKYGTRKAQELREKMTSAETDLLCTDLKKAKALGSKDMNKDLFIALVCN